MVSRSKRKERDKKGEVKTNIYMGKKEKKDWTDHLLVKILVGVVAVAGAILVLQQIFNIIPISSTDLSSLEFGLKISLLLNGVLVVAQLYTILEMGKDD